MNYLHLRSKLFNTPLMIHPAKLREIHHALGERLQLSIEVPVPESDATPPQMFSAAPGGNTVNGRAPMSLFVIPIMGTLVNRGAGMDAMSGLTSYEYLSKIIGAASRDPRADAIVLDFDSFGGEAAGAFDLAREIRDVDTNTKPVFALVNAAACSAAYALASAARKIIATEEAVVGSIGVIATHVDESKHLDKEGFTVTHITFGERKADFASDAPLSKPALKWVQKSVQETGQRFVQLVAEHRGITEDAVTETEAAVFLVSDALRLGLIDKVMPASEALSFITSEVQTMNTNNGNNSPAGTTANAGAPTTTAATPAPATTADAGAATPAAAAPAPTPEATNVVDLDAVRRAGAEQSRAVAAQISEACNAVQKPALAAGFIARGLSLEQAQSELFRTLHGAASQAPVDTTNANPAGATDDAAAVGLMTEAMRGVNARGKPKATR
jgi:signal peptide peptidase SppA